VRGQGGVGWFVRVWRGCAGLDRSRANVRRNVMIH
jgi:hypothetical protein